jgi:hypothetical protein
MAEEEAAAQGGKSLLSVAKTKVGPLPLGVWGVLGLGIFLYIQHRQAAGAGTAGTGTDPAGNVGAIDPATGYVYGSAEDTAALGQSSSIDGGTSSSTGSGSTTAGTYATNNDWSRAAINYLVGLGEDPTVVSQAIQQYLSSQNLTTEQQAAVNLAIQALGPPPDLPGPSEQNPTPVTGGSGTVNASNPPTGVTVSGNVSSTTLSVKWNAVANATGYTIAMGSDPGATNGGTTTAPGTQPAVTIGNLRPGTKYYFRVQATPAATGAPWGGPVSGTTLSATSTAKPPASGGGGTTKPPATGGQTIHYTVVNGDTLDKISQKVFGTTKWASDIYGSNKATIEAAAKAHGKANSGGGHWLYAGTALTIVKR